jgi:hypothetical protein
MCGFDFPAHTTRDACAQLRIENVCVRCLQEIWAFLGDEKGSQNLLAVMRGVIRQQESKPSE